MQAALLSSLTPRAKALLATVKLPEEQKIQIMLALAHNFYTSVETICHEDVDTIMLLCEIQEMKPGIRAALKAKLTEIKVRFFVEKTCNMSSLTFVQAAAHTQSKAQAQISASVQQSQNPDFDFHACLLLHTHIWC